MTDQEKISELDKKIEVETQLIKELKNSYPKYDNSVDRYHKNNIGWEIHHTKVRDAYWRRRMLRSEKDGANKEQLLRTASVY